MLELRWQQPRVARPMRAVSGGSHGTLTMGIRVARKSMEVACGVAVSCVPLPQVPVRCGPFRFLLLQLRWAPRRGCGAPLPRVLRGGLQGQGQGEGRGRHGGAGRGSLRRPRGRAPPPAGKARAPRLHLLLRRQIRQCNSGVLSTNGELPRVAILNIGMKVAATTRRQTDARCIRREPRNLEYWD